MEKVVKYFINKGFCVARVGRRAGRGSDAGACVGAGADAGAGQVRMSAHAQARVQLVVLCKHIFILYKITICSW